METAKAVSLRVRPLQVSHLCFEVGGILGESHTDLGASVAAFDFTAFYGTLGSMPTVPNLPAQLLYDVSGMQAATKPFTLVALRAEPYKASLRKAISARANAYYAKYINVDGIATMMESSYGLGYTQSKPTRLDRLADLSLQQMENLSGAYQNDQRPFVVTTTQSLLDSNLGSRGDLTTHGRSDDLVVSAEVNAGWVQAPPSDASWQGMQVTGTKPAGEARQVQTTYQSSISTGSATEHQKIENTDYVYRIPILENQAQYERAQISLIDEKFASFMYAQNIPYLGSVFQNELTSIDSDVYRTQIAYLNTILMSPIPGIVTGIYKNPGDAVRPGEPVIRVENNDLVFLVATLVYRDLIPIGAIVTVTTTLFDHAGLRTTILGSVVAVRGGQEDDHWEVIVKCNNRDSGGRHIFPLGYHFDYDDTTVSITG